MLWPHRLFSPRPQCAAAIQKEMWGPDGFIPYLVSVPLCVTETPNLSSISNISNLSNKRSFSSALTCLWRASWSVQRRGLRRSIYCVGLLKKMWKKSEAAWKLHLTLQDAPGPWGVTQRCSNTFLGQKHPWVSAAGGGDACECHWATPGLGTELGTTGKGNMGQRRAGPALICLCCEAGVILLCGTKWLVWQCFNVNYF